MANHHLATYLNDHLGGAVAALEMLPRLIDKHADLIDVAVVTRVKNDVEEDRQTLGALMERLGIDQSKMRQAAGWIAERFTRAKLLADDPHDGALRAFETLEIISLGIEGKLSLWKTLASIADSDPVLAGVAYDALMARAREQHAALEPTREHLARRALTDLA